MPQNTTNDLNEPTASRKYTKNVGYEDPRPTWMDTFIHIADVIAMRSRCDRAGVGCVIVDSDQNILAAAYNGPPPGWSPPDLSAISRCSNWCDRAKGLGGTTSDYSNCPSNHAEINALARMTPTTKETTAYVNRLCCITCAKALAAAGISCVICKQTEIDGHIDDDLISNYFKQCNIQFWRY